MDKFRKFMRSVQNSRLSAHLSAQLSITICAVHQLQQLEHVEPTSIKILIDDCNCDYCRKQLQRKVFRYSTAWASH
jgi:hypothetical protein